jgi:hypothetical protein
MLIISNSPLKIEDVKRELTRVFKMTDLGYASYFLGVEIQRDRKERIIWLHQSRYIKDVLERVGMADSKPIGTPMETSTALAPSYVECNAEERRNYQSAVGSLMYLMVATRPDIAFAVGAISRFMANPSIEHQQVVKRVFRYLKRTSNMGLALGGKQDLELIGYSDADWGSTDCTRRSTSGYVYMFGRGAVSWSSKRQASVAVSTTEAEYMALSHAIREAVWLKRLMEQLLGEELKPTTIHVDNQSCIKLVKNPQFHARTKHIELHYHFSREKVEEGVVEVQHCPTKLMVADSLTKPVPKDKHEWCAKAMGVVQVSA